MFNFQLFNKKSDKKVEKEMILRQITIENEIKKMNIILENLQEAFSNIIKKNIDNEKWKKIQKEYEHEHHIVNCKKIDQGKVVPL